MRKVMTFFSLLFVLGFKCGSTETSKTHAVTSTQPAQALEASPVNPASNSTLSTKVSGRLRAVIAGGSYYGEIKSFTADKVIFHSVDYGQEEPEKSNVEDSIHDGLLMDDSGEIGAPIMVFIEVPEGKFPCSTMIKHDPKAQFCNHLVLQTDEMFTAKMTKDADFRVRFGAMLDRNFDADVKNPYFKVSDVP